MLNEYERGIDAFLHYFPACSPGCLPFKEMMIHSATCCHHRGNNKTPQAESWLASIL
jgi:hypothetical protein